MIQYEIKKRAELPSETNETVWAFDLGKGSIGEAVRHGTEFLHKASLLIPAKFWKIKMGLTACAEPRMEVIVCLAAGGLALPNH